MVMAGIWYMASRATNTKATVMNTVACDFDILLLLLFSTVFILLSF